MHERNQSMRRLKNCLLLINAKALYFKDFDHFDFKENCTIYLYKCKKCTWHRHVLQSLPNNKRVSSFFHTSSKIGNIQVRFSCSETIIHTGCKTDMIFYYFIYLMKIKQWWWLETKLVRIVSCWINMSAFLSLSC